MPQIMSGSGVALEHSGPGRADEHADKLPHRTLGQLRGCRRADPACHRIHTPESRLDEPTDNNSIARCACHRPVPLDLRIRSVCDRLHHDLPIQQASTARRYRRRDDGAAAPHAGNPDRDEAGLASRVSTERSWQCDYGSMLCRSCCWRTTPALRVSRLPSMGPRISVPLKITTNSRPFAGTVSVGYARVGPSPRCARIKGFELLIRDQR